jgi:hypothetical protein
VGSDDVESVLGLFTAHQDEILDQSRFEYSSLLPGLEDGSAQTELRRRVESGSVYGDSFGRYLSRVALWGEKVVGVALAYAPTESGFTIWDGSVVVIPKHIAKQEEVEAGIMENRVQGQLEADRRAWAIADGRPISAYVTTTGWTARNRLEKRAGFRLNGRLDSTSPHLNALLVPRRNLTDEAP